jgi:hypothetical protein
MIELMDETNKRRSVYPPLSSAASRAGLHILRLRRTPNRITSASGTARSGNALLCLSLSLATGRREMQRLTPLRDGMVAFPVSVKGQSDQTTAVKAYFF